MKPLTHFVLLLSSLSLIGCGGDSTDDISMAPPSTPPAVADMAPLPAATAVAAPPGGAAPATMEPAASDPFVGYKRSVDGTPDKSDVQALQAIVDAYAFGPDGLGAPRLNSLDDLVTKGFLKKLPAAPQGMKWAYDSEKWKVSQVPQ